jgi:uncharacterized protein YPO0396
VLGHYRTERGEIGLAAKPVALRDANAYSVILGRFRDEAQRRQVTLAQVFWLKDPQGQPARLYVVADAELSIAEHFSGFGSDIAGLRRRLRGRAAVETYDSFPPYGAAYRRRFGIDSEQALDLFYQTVSMKTVGNLTDFVRTHMLEAFPVGPRIDALIGHFDDLNRAHAAVLKAKDQIIRLTPLVADCDEHASVSTEVEMLRRCRDALRAWFAGHKADLLRRRIDHLDEEIARLELRISSLSEKQNRQRTERDEVRQAIQAQGGDRIERLKQEIDKAQAERLERQRRAEQYDRLAREVGLAAASDGEGFVANRRALAAERRTAEDRQAEVQNALAEGRVEFLQLRSQHDELAAELRSLRQRRSNIPRRMLALREALCRASGIAELEDRHRALQARLGMLQQLAVFESFRDLDWRPLAAEIDRLMAECRRLEADSDVLRALEGQLAALDSAIAATEQALDKNRAERARAEERRRLAGELLAGCESLLAAVPAAASAQTFPRLEALLGEMPDAPALTVESCDNRERDMRDWLQARIDAEDHKLRRLAEKIVKAMEAYCRDYPLETQEADASVAAAGEYRAMLARLAADDLPRFEARFKELLNENTIREVANFQSQLNRERQLMRERIDSINRSLHEIDYNPGRYIVLESALSADPDIRDFQQDLRACTEGSLTGSEEETLFRGQIPASRAHHRALPWSRRHRRARPPLDAEGDRHPQLVHLLGGRALARRRSRARALHRFRRQVRRPEGKARLYRARRQPRLSIRPRRRQAERPFLPLRRHRRGLRARFRRFGALRARTVPAPRPAAPRRDPAAEDPHHRAPCRQCRLRAQRGRTAVDAAQPVDRGISRRARGAACA